MQSQSLLLGPFYEILFQEKFKGHLKEPWMAIFRAWAVAWPFLFYSIATNYRKVEV